VVPTILDLAGIPQPAELPGKSLLPAVRDARAESPHEYVFSEWKIPGIRMIRSKEWKYVLHAGGEEELYDLGKDPDELHNLAGSAGSAAMKTRLATALRDHLRSTGDRFGL